MIIQNLNFRCKSSEARKRSRMRTCSPRIEICERRVLLASSGFLQGVVSLNGTSQGLPGAIIQLYELNSPSIPIQTTTTDANGVYLFQNLPSGSYRITETPPAGYISDTSQPNSPLTPILGQTTSSIDVQLSDPSKLQLSYLTHNKEILTLSNVPPLPDPLLLVGQMNISVNEPDINYTTPLFPSFCVDLNRDISTGQTNLPYSMEPLSQGLANDPKVNNPQNAGEIAYLYNKFASTWSTNPNDYVPVAEAAGFQLAIWELEYETSGTYNVLNGSIFAEGLTTSSPEYTYAQNFLAQAQGQTGLAVYLNGLPPANGPAGSQGLIAPESLNFTNQPHSGPTLPVDINGFDYLVSNTTPSGSLTTSTTGIPISGTTVVLTGTDDLGNVINETTTTGANGGYSFTGLNPSNSAGYTVTETPPAADTHLGQTSTTTGAVTTPATTPVVSNIVVNSGQTSTDNFFEIASVSINGTDYLVSNTTPASSLTTSTTGVAIPGTTVTLSGTDEFGNPVSGTTTTNASGQYSFTGMNPSNGSGYTVTETPPATDTHLGQTSTTAGAVTTPAATPVVSNILLTTGGATSTDNFFEIASVSINGTDYLVSNTTPASSLTTSTTGIAIPGTTVTLSGTDEFGNPVSGTTTTNASGHYSFTGMNPSNGSGYTVTETPPATDTHLGQTSTTTGAVTTPAATPVVSSILLTTGGATSTDNFFEIASVSINGTDYLVSNTTTASSLTTSTTGIVIPGTTVTLSGTDDFGNPVSGTTTTNASGHYSFTGMNPSNGSGYTVTETPPANLTHLGQTSTTTGAVTTPAATPLVSNILLTTGGATSTDNFFEIAVDSINGTVFCDCNNDGIQQPSEVGIPGVTLTLTGTDTFDNSVDLVTMTNSQGSYDFSSLNPGTYTITESAPAGYFEGKTTAGTAGGTVSGVVISNITLITGMSASGYNFANLKPSTLSGEVYYDFNQNGVLDNDDFGIAHVTMTLIGTDYLGQSIDMVTMTNNDGVFSFGDLRPGTYEIIRTQPAVFRGYKNAAGNLGGTVNKDSISDITVPACATGIGYLFGELQKPTCSLHGLAISVGNLFYHFERSYQNNPAAFAEQYPNLVTSIAAGQVPWGKAPFPSAPVASYWVPTLGTKPIKIYPVKGVKYIPLGSSTSGQSAVVKVAHTQTSSLKPVTVHTPSAVKPTLLRRIVRK